MNILFECVLINPTVTSYNFVVVVVCLFLFSLLFVCLLACICLFLFVLLFGCLSFMQRAKYISGTDLQG